MIPVFCGNLVSIFYLNNILLKFRVFFFFLSMRACVTVVYNKITNKSHWITKQPPKKTYTRTHTHTHTHTHNKHNTYAFKKRSQISFSLFIYCTCKDSLRDGADHSHIHCKWWTSVNYLLAHINTDIPGDDPLWIICFFIIIQTFQAMKLCELFACKRTQTFQVMILCEWFNCLLIIIHSR